MQNKIGLLIIATNKYINFLNDLLISAENFFCTDQQVTYFIFTNKEISVNTKRNYKIFYTEHKSWPWMTLGRYKMFWDNREDLSKMDYLFYCDVDMKFVNFVGPEILGDRVATLHPGYVGKRGAPETNPESLACIREEESMTYFAGGFNGGSSGEFLKMSDQLSRNIDIDYSKGIVAVWHDESHLNRYLVDNPPTVKLSPSYCYPESWNLPYVKRLLALNKNHAEVRS